MQRAITVDLDYGTGFNTLNELLSKGCTVDKMVAQTVAITGPSFNSRSGKILVIVDNLTPALITEYKL